MGRRKIEIQPLSDERTKTVTFVKRKAGLFKKAYELSVLCEVDMAVIIVGSDRIYEYSSVDTKELLNYYKRQSPFESRSPEDYGEYKKRPKLKSGSFSALGNDEISGSNSDSDSSPEPKRQKKAPSPSSIYAKQPPVNSPFLKSAIPRKQSHTQPEVQSQRPVLRVQIPSDAKSQSNSTDTVTPTDSNVHKKDAQPGSADGQPLQPPPLNAARFPFNSKFRSPESRKPMHQLHVPMSKSQSSSPSTGAMPQLPINGAAGYFSTLPPPSPSGQYPPSILPTPVFNQVFNSQYMNQMNGMPLAGTNINTSAPGVGSMNTASNMPQMQSSSPSGDSGGGQNSVGGEADPAKLKPPLQQQFMNGEHTPVSGLPSRYMHEIFPSPSNLYPSQEWPTGLTPYSSTMSHYFGGLPPSANGAMPHSMNAAFANTRASLPMGQRSIPVRAVSTSNVPSQDSSNVEQDQQSVNTVTQPSSSEYMGQYFKKE